MSVPSYDLTKVQYSSEANSFKNDSTIYSGTLNFPTTCVPGVNTVSSSVTLTSSPVFSVLYAFFQESMDTLQQSLVGSGYNAAQWYLASVDVGVGLTVTAPSAHAGVLSGQIYPQINGDTVTVVGLLNNPYDVNITLSALSVPWAFIEYTLLN